MAIARDRPSPFRLFDIILPRHVGVGKNKYQKRTSYLGVMHQSRIEMTPITRFPQDVYHVHSRALSTEAPGWNPISASISPKTPSIQWIRADAT